MTVHVCTEETNEDLLRIFFSYEFSQNFWLSLKIEWNPELELLKMLIEARNRLDIMCYREALIAGY